MIRFRGLATVNRALGVGTHMVRIDFRDSNNIAPMDSMRWLALLHLVVEAVKSFELIA